MGEYIPHAQAQRKQINILITGFGAFRYTPVNPSWEVVKLLAKDQTWAQSPETSITIDASYVPVEYRYIQQLLPYIHGNSVTGPSFGLQDYYIRARDDFDPDKEYQFYLHIGQGQKGGLKLETVAHQLGYRLTDARNQLADVIDADRHATDALADMPEAILSNVERSALLNRGYKPSRDINIGMDEQFMLTTQFDTHGLAEQLKTQHRGTQILRSVDAGRYVCEYIYFASMAEAEIARRERGNAKPAKVLFVHIPPALQPLSIEASAEVIKSLIMNIVNAEAHV